MNVSILNKSLALIISILNLFFIVKTLSENFQTLGVEQIKYIILPLIIFIFLATVPAMRSFSKKYEIQKGVLILNLFGIGVSNFFMLMFIYGK